MLEGSVVIDLCQMLSGVETVVKGKVFFYQFLHRQIIPAECDTLFSGFVNLLDFPPQRFTGSFPFGEPVSILQLPAIKAPLSSVHIVSVSITTVFLLGFAGEKFSPLAVVPGLSFILSFQGLPPFLIYIESNKHYLHFHTRDNEYRERNSMRDIQDFFSEKGFAMLNSYLMVNLSYVDKVQSNTVEIAGRQILIARAFKTEFLKKMTVFLSDEGM